MNKAMLMCLLLILLITGCAWISKVAPSQLDENGNPIAGTHDVIQPIKNIATNIPYGEAIVGIPLLIWNFVEVARKKRLQKGLWATIVAIEQASKDPKISSDITKLKEYLSTAHDIAKVQPLIQELLAKVKLEGIKPS